MLKNTTAMMKVIDIVKHNREINIIKYNEYVQKPTVLSKILWSGKRPGSASVASFYVRGITKTLSKAKKSMSFTMITTTS